jgi:DNA-binding LacI/PurR family transcriptional regulator
MSRTAARRLPVLKEDEVARRIRQQVAGGKLKPGGCLPSERELSQALGVSRVTVRNGLAKLIREGLIRRRPSKGYFLRGLEAEPGEDKAPVLLFMYSAPETRYDSRYQPDVWAAAREEAARAGRLTVISHVEGQELTAQQAGSFAAFTAGVLCDHGQRAAVAALLGAGLAVVRTGYPRDGLPVDAVVQDNAGGISRAVEHLHERGHRRIGYLDPSADLRALGEGLNAEERRGAYVAACERLGIDLDRRLIAPVAWTAREDPGPAVRAVTAGATALIVPFQSLQPGARAGLAGRGVPLRGAFGLVVWGRQPGVWSEEEYPTHVEWRAEHMGREAVRRLLLRLERPDLEPATVVIPTMLVDCGTGGRGR